VGHLFAALPLFGIPWRVHLTSALFHAAAVSAVVLAAYELTRDRIAAVAAGFALGISGSFLLGSLYAEVFPLNDALFASALALAIGVRHASPSRAGPAFHALAACAGVAAGHQLMFALAVPALAVLVYPPGREFLRGAPSRAFSLVAAFVVPVVLAHALTPLAASRSPYLSWGGVHDASSFVKLVTRDDYGGLLHPSRHPSTDSGWTRVEAFSELIFGSAGIATLFGAAAGVAARLRRDRVVGVALLLAILVPGPVFAWLNALPVRAVGRLEYFERFTTMCTVAVALAFACGVQVARAWLAGRRAGTWVVASALLSWAAFRAYDTRGIDLHADRRGIEFAHALLLSTPDRSLVLLSGDQLIDSELYVCGVERLCGDRIAFAPGMLALPWKMAEVRTRHPDLDIPWTDGPALARTHLLVGAQRDRPVYLSPDLLLNDPLLASLDTSREGFLLRVRPGY
jgi:hypothetical protein